MDNLLQPEQWVFKTNLGWMALVLRSKGIERLIFGYDTQSALREHLLQILPMTNIKKNVDHTYVQSLMDYAAGVQVSFNKFQLTLSIVLLTYSALSFFSHYDSKPENFEARLNDPSFKAICSAHI